MHTNIMVVKNKYLRDNKHGKKESHKKGCKESSKKGR